MTNEERDIITQFIARVSGAQAPAQPAFGGSVPATTTPALPPVDPEADRLIGDMFNRYPAARYRMTQLAFVQEHALAEAQNRIQRLEWELQQAQQAAQQASSSSGTAARAAASSAACSAAGRGRPRHRRRVGRDRPGTRAGRSRAISRAGRSRAIPQQGAPPPPQYAPSYQPGMFQRSGSGFLGSALTTAAGVAGGLVAGNALMSLFSGSHSFGGGGFGGAAAGGGPWGGAQADQGYVDQGTWTDPAGGGSADPGYVDSGTWDTSSNDPLPVRQQRRRFRLGQRRRIDRRYVLTRRRIGLSREYREDAGISRRGAGQVEGRR